MKSRWSDELSGALSDSLGKRECFGVIAPQEICASAFWEALTVSFVGDNSGIILFVALGEYRRRAFREVLNELNLGEIPQIQITTPQILEHLLAVDETRFLKMIALCRHIVVWLHPDDYRDSTLDYWFEIVRRIPNPNVGYIHVAPAKVPLFDSIHPGMRWIGHSRTECAFLPIVHYLEGDKAPGEILDHSFWKTCRNRRTLVSCRNSVMAIACEEAAHHAHIPTLHTRSKENTAEFMTFMPDACSSFVSCRTRWEHYVLVDAPFYDGIAVEVASSVEQPKAVSLVVSSPFSLVHTLAARFDPELNAPHEQRENTVFFEVYRLFSRVAAKPMIAAEVKTPQEQALIDFWNEQGWLLRSQSIELTNAGHNLFAGIPHFSSLGALHGYCHETICENLNHETLGLVNTAFLNHLAVSQFRWGSLSLQCAFHNHLDHHAVFKGGCGADHYWLDDMPFICSYERTQAMKRIILGDDTIDGVVMTDAPSRELAQIRAHFKDITASSWIEITPGAAQWWTFAGAQNNAFMASILRVLSPRLDISYGNLCLHLRWRVSGTWRAAPVIKRLSELSQQLCQFAANGIDGKQKPAIQECWKSSHLWRSLFVLMPTGIQNAAFDRDFSLWAHSVQTPEILEVQALHTLSASLLPPILACEATEPPAQKIQHAATPSQKPVPKAPVQPVSSASNALPPIEPIERGDGSIMHTRYPWSYIADNRALANAINTMLAQPFIGLDVETTLFDQRLCLIQIGCARQTFIIDPLCVDFSPLAQVFESPNLIKVIHNSSFECKVLGKYGIQINNIVDTLKVSRKRYGMKCPGGHSLRAVCLREFGFDMDKTNQTSRWDKRPLSADQLEYAALDAEILVHLYRHFEC